MLVVPQVDALVENGSEVRQEVDPTASAVEVLPRAVRIVDGAAGLVEMDLRSVVHIPKRHVDGHMTERELYPFVRIDPREGPLSAEIVDVLPPVAVAGVDDFISCAHLAVS